MKKLEMLFKHCFEEAEKISKQNNLSLSKGVMDVPGLADSMGRAPFLEYPVLTSEKENNRFRIVFTYETDISQDIEGKNYFGAVKEFKTPWLRFVYPLVDSGDHSIFRIYKWEKTFQNKLKSIFQIIPGEEIRISGSTEFSYYLLCPVKSAEMKQKMIVSEFIPKLENFKNISSLRIDRKELVADILCDQKEQYSSELILSYISQIDSLSKVILKL